MVRGFRVRKKIIMTKEQIDKLRQDFINALYSNTELSNGEIYEIVENVLRKNGLV